MDRFDEGLRCQDVHAGLRNVDPNSGSLTQLADTQMIGMAASLAALIRGQDVISDAQALRSVAAEQLDVSPFAFDGVILQLADVGSDDGHRPTFRRIARGSRRRFPGGCPSATDVWDVTGADDRAHAQARLSAARAGAGGFVPD